jgi:hypothetical protein
MTPASMMRVLEGLIRGTRLLSSQRQSMDGNCLGWDRSINGKASNYLAKAGGAGDNSASLQIFFGILAGTIPWWSSSTPASGKTSPPSFKLPWLPPPAPGSRTLASAIGRAELAEPVRAHDAASLRRSSGPRGSVVRLAQMVAAMPSISGDHSRIRTGRMWLWCRMTRPPRR